MTSTDTPAKGPALDRPRFHVWMGEDPEDPAPDYVGVVTITNADQLTAETQAKGLGIDAKAHPFRLTNLWLWCAMVRRGLTSDKFPVFTNRCEYRPLEADQAEAASAEDPTVGAPGPNTDSA